ncbi:MAG: branched-chain amino acid ABC transporter permease [Fimbriimonadia bacterium]|jgi:branched-chain amino acid transport system permease protein
MDELIQQIIVGLQAGAVYALIALGYTMVYGVLRLINFAHGEVYMVGAFTALFISRWLQAPAEPAVWKLVVMLLGAMAVCMLLGMSIEYFAYRPLRKQPRIASLITAIGVSLFLQNVAILVFPINPPPAISPDVMPFPPSFSVGAVRVDIGKMTILAMSVLLMFILRWLVMGTKMGRGMRAASHDFDAAALMGVNVNKVVTFTFAVGSALAGAAAMLNATFLGTTLNNVYGLMPGVKAFVAAVLGGIGNIPGAALGGMLMGLAETGVSAIGFSNYRDAVAFVILIVVLLLRPGGLLGSAKAEKV